MFCNTDSIYNNYRVLKLIGNGAYGQVYKVENDLNKKIYAMKTVLNNGSLSVRREFEILNQINNSNLIKLEDKIFTLTDNPLVFCMITEYCEKGSLRDLIKEKKKEKMCFDLELVFDWMKSIVDGLHYLHNINIIHRDIKPGNILVDIDNNIKIADFGISRFDDDTSTLTPHRGTIYYMSPEMKAYQPYDFKTDIWSIGCVLFELVTLKKFKEFIEKNSEDYCIRTLIKLARLLKLMLIKKQEDRADTETIKKHLPKLQDQTGQEVVIFNEISDRQVSKSKIKIPSSFLPAQVVNFTGREDVLEKIEEAFLRENKRIIVLCSFAGTGKSTIANEFGYRFKAIHRDNYSYWMKSDENNLYTEYAKLAEHMNIELDASQNSENLMRKINTKIHHLDEGIKILFILDNCDNYEKIESYIKNLQRNTLVLITTRDSSFEDQLREENSCVIHLEPFEHKECIEFMKKTLGNKVNESDLIELLNLVDFTSNQSIRPYVLNKLAALIKLKTKLKTFRALLNDYKNQKLNDFKMKIIQEDELFDELVKKEPSSWKILKYSSFLNPDFIPIEIFTEMLNVNEDELADVLDLLRRLSMISKEEEENFVGLKLHRTLQDEIQQYLKFNYENEYANMIDEFIQLLNRFFQVDITKIIAKGQNKSIFYYNFKRMIETILKLPNIDNDLKSNLGYKFGNYNYSLGKFQNSIEYYEKYLDVSREKELFLFKIAQVFGHIGKYDKALENYFKLLDIDKNQKDLDSKLVADIYSGIGQIFTYQCKYEEAHENLNKALNIFKSLFKDEINHDIAMTLNKIGMTFRYQANYSQAYQYYMDSLNIYRKLYPTQNNSNIAEVLQNIGTILCDQGKYAESLSYYEDSKELYKNIYDSEETFLYSVVLTNIAQAYTKLSLNDKAMEYSQKSLEIFSKVVKNEENIKLADAYKIQGLICLNTADYEKCLEWCVKALIIFRNVFKTDYNLRIAQILNIIGSAKFKLNDSNGSKLCYQQSLDIYKIVYKNEENNLNVIDTLDNMAMYYEHENDYQEAIKFYENSLQIRKKFSNQSSTEISDITNRIHDLKIKINYDLCD